MATLRTAAKKTAVKKTASKKMGNKSTSIQTSSFYVNALRAQRAVVIYTDSWTYVLDNNNVVKPPQPQPNQYTQFCQSLMRKGMLQGRTGNCQQTLRHATRLTPILSRIKTLLSRNVGF
jgi:hypothetical protein